MKVLIAEDDNMSRLRLKGLLKKWGYDVTDCANGKDAWDALQEKNPPRLLILDWLMPEMDGIELCRNILNEKHSSYIYILLLSSKNQKSDIVEAMKAGADDYISKPFSPDELKVRVRAGKRVLELNDKLAESKKLEAMLEMTINVAHEVNNPLSMINMSADLLMKNADNAGSDYEFLNNIKDNVKRIAKFVKSIQNIHSHKYSIDPQTGNFRED